MDLCIHASMIQYHCVVVLIFVALYQDLKKARKKNNYQTEKKTLVCIVGGLH